MARATTKAPLRPCTPVAPTTRVPLTPPSVSSDVTATRSNTLRTPKRRQASRSSSAVVPPHAQHGAVGVVVGEEKLARRVAEVGAGELAFVVAHLAP
ncbi:MAG: hypothetical protein U1F67_11690 [Rubrivivax sp.]